jgi:recombination protein RecT
MGTLELIADTKPLFIGALGNLQTVDWEAESQFALQSLQKNDYLAKIAANQPHTLQNAIINIAACGISLNPALKHAYLVPRDNSVHLDISYMGLLHLAMESKAIIFGQARLVKAKDQYENQGLDKAPLHKANTFGDRGEVVGCYCSVKLSNGDFLTEEMTIEELNKVKDSSKAKKGPWQTWPEEMMRKTVVKRASKYWPHTDRLSAATEYLNDVEGNSEKIVEAEVVEYYSEDDFAENFPKWSEIIAAGTRTPAEIIAVVGGRFNLSDIQVAAIESLGDENGTL